jgi:NTE family protein
MLRLGAGLALAASLLAAGLAAPAPAQTDSSSPAQQPAPARRPSNGGPRIGLALGGGGARGVAHIGVIRKLEELHVPIDYIVGTSMGSIIGGLYACGYTPDEMEKLIRSIHWDTLFQDAPDRKDQSFRQKEDDFDHLIPLEFGLNLKKGGLVLPPGLIAGSKLGYILENATLPCTVPDFDHLRIPFRAVATDIQTGKAYVMSKGDLGRAIRASMAIPAIFTPVEMDGHLLIDGGEAENLPVQTTRSMGADVVIAVNVGSSGAEIAARPENVGAMIGRLIDLPLQQNTQASAKLADLVITPDLEGYTSADFAKGPEMIPRGVQAAETKSAELSKWSDPPDAYEAWKRGHDLTLPPLPYIDAIEIAPVPGVDPRTIEDLVKTKAGRTLDTVTLGHDLKRIYGLGYFEIVSYEIVADGNRNILKITATPKSWGPTFFKAGLSLGTDFQLNTEFGVVALIDATQLNSLGARWKTTLTLGSPLEFKTRFFQPLEYSQHLFVSPYFAWRHGLARLFNDDGDALATYQVSRGVGGVDVGYDFGSWGELRVGYARAFAKAHLKVGDPLFPNLTADEGGITASMQVDQLDNVNLPKSGYAGLVLYFANRESLGASASYDNLAGTALGVHTIGRWTGLAKIEGGSGLSSDIPFYDQFNLGGLFRLSGRPIGQLTGDRYGLGTFLIYYRLTKDPGAIIKGLYAGLSAEFGNVWSIGEPMTLSGLKSGGSVFIVTDTLVGPLFIGYGHSGGNSSAYLFLNRSF